MVPAHDQQIAIQGGRRPLAEPLADPHVAQVGLPQRPAIEVVAIETPRPEERADHLSIGDRRRRGPGAGLVGALVWQLLLGDALPDHASVAPIDRQNREPLCMRGRHAAQDPSAKPGEQAALGSRLIAGRHRREDEQPVAPDDRCARTPPRNLHLPPDVGGLAPLDGRRAMRRHTGAERPPPLWPETVRADRLLREAGGHRQRRQTDYDDQHSHPCTNHSIHINVSEDLDSEAETGEAIQLLLPPASCLLPPLSGLRRIRSPS